MKTKKRTRDAITIPIGISVGLMIAGGLIALGAIVIDIFAMCTRTHPITYDVGMGLIIFALGAILMKLTDIDEKLK